VKVDLTINKARGVQRTDIEWADYSANPIRARDRVTGEVGWACRKVSAGCANCYAEALNKRFGTKHPYTAAGLGQVEQVLDEGVLRKLLTMRPRGPFNNGRERPAVFLGDMMDLFYGDEADERAAKAAGVPFAPIPFDMLDRLFAVMALRTDIDFLLLTKRPGRMREYFEAHPDFDRALDRLPGAADIDIDGTHLKCVQDSTGEYEVVTRVWPLPNVWGGTSVESDAVINRVDELRKCRLAVRFLSCEPLIGKLNLNGMLRKSQRRHIGACINGLLRNRQFDCLQHDDGTPMTPAEAEADLRQLQIEGVEVIPCVGRDKCPDFHPKTGCPGHPQAGIDWVIVGGESGRGARPCDLAWIRGVVEQCREAKVPCFVKQLGYWIQGPHDFDGWHGAIDRFLLKSEDGSTATWHRPVLRSELHPERFDERPRNAIAWGLGDPKGGDPAEWPQDLRVRQIPGGGQ
jgi:protein gp37